MIVGWLRIHLTDILGAKGGEIITLEGGMIEVAGDRGS